ncbi:MAG: phage tail sheath family protein [Methylococcaceae bacterium]
MPNYLAPGTYVEEVPSENKPIGMVGTSLAAFIGLGPAIDKNVNQAIACNNWSEFCKSFVVEESKSTDLSNAVYSFFNNGGSRCYVVNIGTNGTIAGDERERSGLCAFEILDEIAIVVGPGYIDAASQDALISHCEKLGDRVAVLDAPEQVTNIDNLKAINTISNNSGEAKEGEVKKPASSTKNQGFRPRNSDDGYAAFYFPWFIGRDPLQANTIVNIPPSGAIAGIYARTDATRGVHKAPANEIIRGALGLTYNTSKAEHGGLNKLGVNVIRSFHDGIRVFGARTLAAESSEWRYVSVRRTCNMIKESIEEGTRWAVFQNNDYHTWQNIKRDIHAFLMRVWRDGGLMGATPEQAFYVKCDAETNPAENRDAGMLVTEIGICPVKPAEFVVFRIGQKSDETETTV